MSKESTVHDEIFLTVTSHSHSVDKNGILGSLGSGCIQLIIVSAIGELDRCPSNYYSRTLAALGPVVILVDVDGSQGLGLGAAGMKMGKSGSGIGERSEASGSLTIW